MGNTQYNTRWVLDSIGEVVAAGTLIRIQAIHFVGDSDVDEFGLTDANDKLIWGGAIGDITVSGNHCSIYFGERGQVVYGLKVSVLDGGIMIVYLARQ